MVAIKQVYFLFLSLVLLIFISVTSLNFILKHHSLKTLAASQNARDPFLQPFARDSIWNLPISNTAELAPAGLLGVAEGFGNDEEIILKATVNDPLVDVYDINVGGDWDQRCLANEKIGQLHFPTNKTYQDPAGSGDTPNYSGAILQPDGKLYHFNAIATCGNNKIAVYQKNYDEQDRLRNNRLLNGLGIQGGHGGSNLSGIGGSIRLGELTSSEPIKHALKLNVYANRFLSQQDGGYVWPADNADGYYLEGYFGTNPNVKMGSLLTLKESDTLNSLGITNPVVAKFFQAIQDYGIYITDDTYWDHYDIMAETGVDEEIFAAYGINFEQDSDSAYGQDMTKLLVALQVVTNNSANTPGGGVFDPNNNNRRASLASCLPGENSLGCLAPDQNSNDTNSSNSQDFLNSSSASNTEFSQSTPQNSSRPSPNQPFNSISIMTVFVLLVLAVISFFIYKFKNPKVKIK